ncbi:MAG: tyrosine--tRNA ligase [Bacteroidota bacterium]|nr:tyrosine--tRNA ligase [Bacteroidota bacterium]
MDFIKELTWRGMINNIMPGTDKQLETGMNTAYIGVDPTADSLHIGHLAGVMMLKHFQEAGHKPILVLGGATGMIGDPSGKSKERNILTIDVIKKNQEGIKQQLERFLDFSEEADNGAEILNNYDWMSRFSFLDFIRDIGKHMTVNYMISKDSVKKRMGATNEKDAEGLSFTEFSYQLVQGYDFLHLYREKNCKIQMGGSDQWGNITTGTELIKRVENGKAYAVTCPLITKADGGKFGKTEEGNIWLDPEKTTPYEFYQFWLNAGDEDAEKYLKIFTLIGQPEIKQMSEEHKAEPYRRILQKRLAEELTVMVHGREAYENSVEASKILFGKGTKKQLEGLNEKTFLSLFKGVPIYRVEKEKLLNGRDVFTLLSEDAEVFSSKGEIRRLMKDNGLSLNQEKFSDTEQLIDESFLINKKYIVVRRGKKKYHILHIV